jgi:hypothetical protein
MTKPGDTVRIAHNADLASKHPAFLGHGLWEIARIDPLTGHIRVYGLPGFWKSWVRVKLRGAAR